MTFNSADLMMMGLLLAIACVLTYAVAKRAFGRSAASHKQATERQLGELTGMVQALQAEVAEFRKSASAASAMPVIASVSPSMANSEAHAPGRQAESSKEKEKEKEEEISPELLVILAAAVTAFLGKQVRIRTAKMLQSPYEIVNPWSQQGRVIVQASHNIRSRG